MATKFRPGTKIQREVKIFGVEQPVLLTITEDGVSASVKGGRKHLFASWHMIVAGSHTPVDVPSHLAGDPIKFLNYFANRKKERK